MENWYFSSSIYFWFISLTTIGYGDLHFDRDRHLANPHLLLISASLLLFGLGMVVAVIESFALALEKKTSEEEEEEEDVNDFIDFEDYDRVTTLVLGTVTCGAGILMESIFDASPPTDDDSDHEIKDRRRRSFRRLSFMEQTVNAHHMPNNLPEVQEDELTQVDEIQT